MSKMFKFLYFVEGQSASPAQIDEGLGVGKGLPEGTVKVEFLNAHLVNSESPLIQADGVMGQVPELYREYPNAKTVVKAVETSEEKEKTKKQQTPKAEPDAKK